MIVRVGLIGRVGTITSPTVALTGEVRRSYVMLLQPIPSFLTSSPSVVHPWGIPSANLSANLSQQAEGYQCKSVVHSTRRRVERLRTINTERLFTGNPRGYGETPSDARMPAFSQRVTAAASSRFAEYLWPQASLY